MAGALSGLFTVVQVLQVIFFYCILGAILLMLYKVSKELGDVKRTLADMEERIVLAMLPREARPDKAERL
jgi:hypothetical protein